MSRRKRIILLAAAVFVMWLVERWVSLARALDVRWVR